MIITQTEQAIVTRLRQGLGRLVKGVHSYGGELDGDFAEVIRQLPGAWVSFGGIQKSENVNLMRRKIKATGRFVVIVGARSVRSEEASRHGGAAISEVGSHQLVYAVRRLLSGQDLALPIDSLAPGRVRPLFNTQLEKQALSLFACEFDTTWIDEALENGKFPLADLPATDPDGIFTTYQGTHSPDDPDWLSTRLTYNLPGSPAAAEDIVNHEDPDR